MEVGSFSTVNLILTTQGRLHSLNYLGTLQVEEEIRTEERETKMATMASAPSQHILPSSLRKEIKQCKVDIQSSPFPSKERNLQAVYFSEVHLGEGNWLWNIPLPAPRFKNWRKNQKSPTREDPPGVQTSWINFKPRILHGPNLCLSWVCVFARKDPLIRRAAMAGWLKRATQLAQMP